MESITNLEGEIIEVKYPVPRRLRNVFLSVFRQKAVVPRQFSFGAMRTTYFDDAAHRSYEESMGGQLSKKKYRFREYLTLEEGAALYSLEVKMKYNIKTKKAKKFIYSKLPESYEVSTFKNLITTFEKALNAPLSFIRRELPDSELFPDMIFYCDRFRFEDVREKDVRYNLDTNVLVCSCAKPYVNGSHHGVHLDHDILEVKSYEPDFFPSFLKNFGLQPFAISKFTWGKGRSRPENFEPIDVRPESFLLI